MPKWTRQLGRFATTGGLGLLANLTLLAALVEVGRIPEAYAAIVSTGVVLAGGFLLTDRWVFDAVRVPSGKNHVATRGGAYYAVMLAGKGVNYGLYLILLWAGIWYPLAWLIGAVIVFGGTFLANRFLWINVFAH